MTTENAVKSLTIGQLSEVAELSFKFTGTKDMATFVSLMQEKMELSSELYGSTLKDWCKLMNKNYVKVFNHLRSESVGIIDHTNRVTAKGIKVLQDPTVGEAIHGLDLVLFNTYKGSTHRLIVNPTSPHYGKFLEITKNLGSYVGSKGYNVKKVCKSMREACKDYGITA